MPVMYWPNPTLCAVPPPVASPAWALANEVVCAVPAAVASPALATPGGITGGSGAGRRIRWKAIGDRRPGGIRRGTGGASGAAAPPPAPALTSTRATPYQSAVTAQVIVPAPPPARLAPAAFPAADDEKALIWNRDVPVVMPVIAAPLDITPATIEVAAVPATVPVGAAVAPNEVTGVPNGVTVSAPAKEREPPSKSVPPPPDTTIVLAPVETLARPNSWVKPPVWLLLWTLAVNAAIDTPPQVAVRVDPSVEQPTPTTTAHGPAATVCVHVIDATLVADVPAADGPTASKVTATRSPRYCVTRLPATAIEDGPDTVIVARTRRPDPGNNGHVPADVV